jgi:hypothetical protein
VGLQPARASPRLGCVDELPNHHPGCYEVNEGQKSPTELVISSRNTPAVFEFVEKPFYLLAACVLFLIIGDLFETIPLTGDHSFHALIMKPLPNSSAVIGLVHDGCVQLGEGREVVPHQREARGIMPGPTGQDQADARVFSGAGGM